MSKTRQCLAVWQVAFVPPRVSTPKTRTKLGFLANVFVPGTLPARTHKRAPNGAPADKGLKIAANAYQRNARRDKCDLPDRRKLTRFGHFTVAGGGRIKFRVTVESHQYVSGAPGQCSRRVSG